MAAFAEDVDEAISSEETLAIASQFLLSSPPGEIKEVLNGTCYYMAALGLLFI